MLTRLDVKLDEYTVQLAALRVEVAALPEKLARQTGVPYATLRALLVRMGEAEVSDDEVEARLVAKAEEYLTLREHWAEGGGVHPGLATVRAAALAQLDAGDPEGARRLLAKARERIRAARQERSREEATLLADEAAVDRLELRYWAAAKKYGDAAALVAFDVETQFDHLAAKGHVLQTQGSEFGDNQALRSAIDIWSVAATLRDRVEHPLAWAMTQNNLGNALSTLGEREAGTARLEEAVAAYRASLEERTRERVPLAWAVTQNNLGVALCALGNRETGTVRLEAAIAATTWPLRSGRASGCRSPGR